MKTSQERIVLQHLKEHGNITSWQAFIEYGITRLSACIFILRQKGFNIISHNVTSKNRYGNSTTFSRYILNNVITNT